MTLRARARRGPAAARGAHRAERASCRRVDGFELDLDGLAGCRRSRSATARYDPVISVDWGREARASARGRRRGRALPRVAAAAHDRPGVRPGARRARAAPCREARASSTGRSTAAAGSCGGATRVLVDSERREEDFSCNPRWAARTAARPAADEMPLVGVGASLGALALLHLHWTRPRLVGRRSLLQSGSFFHRDTERYERRLRAGSSACTGSSTACWPAAAAPRDSRDADRAASRSRTARTTVADGEALSRDEPGTCASSSTRRARLGARGGARCARSCRVCTASRPGRGRPCTAT